MNERLNFWLWTGLFLGFLATTGIGFVFKGQETALALASGYTLFSFNFYLLTKIYGGLLAVSRTGQVNPKLRWGLLAGSGLKFLGLIAILYLFLAEWKLSGIFVALGSLVSLFILTSFLVAHYLRSFGAVSRQ